jgi:glycerophosphoryl diester phosphodiesterase
MNRLVAHRGDMSTYPENSMLAFQAAIELGFTYVELDIQLSKDKIPIVIHDDNFKRTAGIDKNVRDLTADEINSIYLNSSTQSENINKLLKINTLKQVIEKLNVYSKITVFVEIKRQSIEHFGLSQVVDQVLDAQMDAKFNIVIISFVGEAIEYVKSMQSYPTGLVLKKYNQKYLLKAKELQPDYLFCNIKKINNPSDLWDGLWRWVLYDITNPSFAYELLEQGVDLIETGDVKKLSTSEYFQ